MISPLLLFENIKKLCIYFYNSVIIYIGDSMEPLKYFEDFLSIPRESGNEKGISNYLVEFAKVIV